MNTTNTKHIRFLIRRLKEAAIFILLLLIGCTEQLDMPTPEGQEGVPEGMVRITINPSIEQPPTIITRTTLPSTTDKAIGPNTYILVATTNTPAGVLVQSPTVATLNSDTPPKLQATLYEQSTDCHLWVVANVTSAENNYLTSLAPGTTIATIANALKHRLPASPNNTISSPLPMYGVSEAIKLKKGGTSLSISIPLSRSIARIDVDGSASTANFMIHSMQIVNGASYGYTLPQTTLPSFGETEVIEYKEIIQTASTTMTDLLFCYENSDNTDGANDRTTRVVIKGTPTINGTPSTNPSYYPIDIIYPDPTDPANTCADIERNKLYKITLKRVEKDGYRTYKEAAQSEAFNKQLEMDIVVSDPYAHDITTNGKQYLGITNSEFVLYPRTQLLGNIQTSIDVSNIHIATYTYTSDPGWSTGSITFEGNTGLSIATGSTTRLEVSPFPITRDLIINISKTFTSGTVVLHIGNLRKEIKVRRMAATSPTGGIYSDYVSGTNLLKEYKVGEIIAPSTLTSWLKVSANAMSGAGESSLNDKVVHPDGCIYIHAEPNAGYNGTAIDREAMLYVAGNRDDQRIKIMVMQTTFDVYDQSVQLEPYAYVGTFHRWNETGERLIRIKADFTAKAGTNYDPAKVYWQANVVAGREFIVLDTEKTKDTGITTFSENGDVNWNGKGDVPIVTTSAAIETSTGGQLDSKLRSVQGTGNNIYFRVGLTGKLAGPEAQPRYGLITISYGYDGSTPSQHNIYVRQGEAADYLMRPWDPSTTHPNGWYDYNSSSRPKARKLTPYNLTYIGPSSAAKVNEGTNGYNFVDYPSQGGYYFPGSGTEAYSPLAPSNTKITTPPFNINISDQWKTDWETCPRGYRRPNDGKGRAYGDIYGLGFTDPGGSNPYYPTDIIDSEVRQSIWLFPLHGGFKSDFTNQIRGFLADGYFDRREITQSALTTESPAGRYEYGIVETNSTVAAYRGYLVFNPHNYASIFIPLAGRFDQSNGFKHKGDAATLQTKTPGKSDNDGWTLQASYATAYNENKWVFDIYQKTSNIDGYSIRCIKDEQEIISSQPGSGGGNVTIDPITPSDPNTQSQLAIRHLYTGTSTLQAQIEAEYNTPEIRKRINSIAISGDKTLTPADYSYLNAWATGTQYTESNLHHLIIRGKGNSIIPAGAFTSSQWSNIMLMNVAKIETGAFAGGVVSGTLPYAVTGMRNLTLGHLDPITIEAGAFQFPTALVQLHLDRTGDEYANANKTTLSWKNYTWNAIKGD